MGRIDAGLESFQFGAYHGCMKVFFAVIAGCCSIFLTSAAAEIIETDVCVFGGTASGVSAACTAARFGRSVVITEFGKHIGGLTSGGLGYTDIGNKAAIGGFARTFYKLLGKHYGKDEAWTFEPHVAEETLRQLLRDAHVPVHFEQRLASVTMAGTRIREITMENRNVFRAKFFIDCTYEGDLMAKAGVKYMVGREANVRFDETLNGIRAETPKHQFTVPVDPFDKPGDAASGVLPFIQPNNSGTAGDADKSVQAYNFRLCLTKNPANKRPIDPPTGYDAKRYELLGRYLAALTAAGQTPSLKQFIKIDMVTPEKTDVNNNGGFSTDFIGANYDYPDGDFATRAKIWKAHEDYIRGFLTFLTTDSRVPSAMRDELKQWGLCKDEFVDTGGWPHAMYVREARRMLSAYVMIEKNCRGLEKANDPVGLGAYNMDSHNCRRVVRNGRVENEGDVQVGVKPYGVSFRSIVPKESESENLLVPVCLSASHIAYGSIRMEPVFMILGQSAATAAHLAMEKQVAVQRVDYAALRARLLEDGQVLEWTGNTGAATMNPPPVLEGIVLDDSAAKRTGDWTPGSLIEARRVGDGYVHDGNEHKGLASLQWQPKIPEAGEYELLFYFPPNPNRATNVPVSVRIGDIVAKTVIVDQRTKGNSVSLGVFALPKGAETSVIVANRDTNGYVVADGLQVLRRRK
jgi:hypothetical protein